MSVFSRAWNEVYPISGYKQADQFAFRQSFPSLHSEVSGEEEADRGGLNRSFDTLGLMAQPAIRVLTFLGLPVRARIRTPVATHETPQNIQKLLLNFIGWPDNPWAEMSNGRRVLAVATAFVALPWHVITMPLKFIQNIAKLVTEFLPRSASIYLMEQSKNIKKQLSSGAKFLSGVLAGLSYAAYAIFFIGRAMTSPIQGVRQAYHQNDIRSGEFEKPLPAPARVFLAGLSAALTITAYSLLLPIILPLIIAKVPMLAQGIAALSQTKVGVWLGKALSTVGDFISPVVGTALEALGIAAAPAAIVGGASLLGIGAATVAPVVDKLIDEAADKIDSSTKKVFRKVKREDVPEARQGYDKSESESEPEPAPEDSSSASQSASPPRSPSPSRKF